MTKVKKIILSLSIIFTALISMVIGVACNFKPLPTQSVISEDTANTDLPQTEELVQEIKPETYTFNEGEVSIQTGAASIEYTVSAATSTPIALAYEYMFNNPMTVDMAVNLKKINVTGVTLSYAYSDSPLEEITQTSNIFDGQRIAPNKTKYIYVVVSDIVNNYSGDIVWYQGEAGELTIYNSNGTAKLLESDIVKGQDITNELTKISRPSGHYIDDVFYDTANTEYAPRISQGGTFYFRTANLPTNWLSYDSTNKCYYVKKGSATLPADLVIPATYDNGTNGKAYVEYIATASSSANGVFYQQTGLTSITMPNTITEIGDHAFGYCKYATTITLSQNLQTIGTLAFRDCLRTTAFKIPASVRSIGSQAFLACLAVTDLEVEAGNKVYDSRNDCNAIIETATDKLVFGFKTTVIPEGVKTIAAYSYAYITSLQSLTIPSTVTSIEKPAFVKMTDLATIVVDEDNAVFDSRNDCNAVINTSSDELVVGCKNTVIPADVVSIASNAFHECLSLTSITIPSSVTTIDTKAFTASSNLTNVTFEETDYFWNVSSTTTKLDVCSAVNNASYIKSTYVENTWTRGDVVIKCCYIGSTPYPSIQKALAVAQSGDVVYLYPTAERKIIFSNCTIPSGVTLRICHDSAGTASTSVATYTSEHMTTIGGNCTNTLTINSGVTLSLASGAVLDVVGELKATNIPSNYTGQTAGNYAQISMLANSKISAQQGTIECTGYIKESYANNGSSITMGGKSSLYLPFIILDYKGGSYMYATYYKDVSPFNQYQLRNITAQLTLSTYSSIVGYANVWLNDEVQTMEVKLAGEGEDYIYQLETDTSYVVIKTNTSGITSLDFYGDMTLNPLKMNVTITISVNMTSENFHFPIPWTMNITLYSGTYNFEGQDIKLLPGGNLTIEDGAIVNASDIVVYESFTDNCTIQPTLVYPYKSSAVLLVQNSGDLICSRLAGPAKLYSGSGSTITIKNDGLSHMNSYETKGTVSGLGGPLSSIGVEPISHTTTISYESNLYWPSSTHTYTANTPVTYEGKDEGNWSGIIRP